MGKMSTSVFTAPELPKVDLRASGASKNDFNISGFSKIADAARHDYATTVHVAAQMSLKELIKGLLALRKDRKLTDDEFSELMELVFGAYVENEVSSRVEALLGSRLPHIFTFKLGLK